MGRRQDAHFVSGVMSAVVLKRLALPCVTSVVPFPSADSSLVHFATGGRRVLYISQLMRTQMQHRTKQRLLHSAPQYWPSCKEGIARMSTLQRSPRHSFAAVAMLQRGCCQGHFASAAMRAVVLKRMALLIV